MTHGATLECIQQQFQSVRIISLAKHNPTSISALDFQQQISGSLIRTAANKDTLRLENKLSSSKIFLSKFKDIRHHEEVLSKDEIQLDHELLTFHKISRHLATAHISKFNVKVNDN